MPKFMSEILLPDNHYMAIGKIMAHWSMMEWHIGVAIAEILDLDRKEGRALMANAPASATLPSLRLLAIMRVLDSDKLEELLALINDAENLIGDRNLIAHALWARDADSKLHILKYKGGKKHEKRVLGEPIPMEDGEIEDIRDRIMMTCLGFMNWVEDLIDARKSSQ